MIFGPSVFVFANMRDSPEGGFEPDLPAECQFAEVATPHRKSRWRLYECSLEPVDPRGWTGVEEVPANLGQLLRQARNHPRAASVARAQALDQLESDQPVLMTRESFAMLFMGLLARALSAPPIEFELDFVPLGPGE